MSVSHYNYPKYYVAVDCIIFGYENEELKILLSHRRFQPAFGEWSLMGGWVREGETVEKAAERILFQITGLKDIYLEQVQVFSEPGRDPGGRVISVAFYAMIRIDRHDKKLVKEHGAEWWPIDQKPKLIFDHNEMVEIGHEKLKMKAGSELIGKDLLPSKFTILQLRALYEAIFQRSFDPGNIRKKILSLKLLERLNEKNTTDSKKGAYYYRFKKPTESLSDERVIKQLSAIG
jgi:8-oxo-dGTP diphosphatase